MKNTEAHRIVPADRKAKTTTCKTCGGQVQSIYSPRRGFHYIHIEAPR